MHAHYLFELNWIDYLADTGSMNHEQDPSTLLRLGLVIVTKLIIIKINISNAHHVTTKINRLIILISFDNCCLFRVYIKHLDLNLELTYRILIRQNIVVTS